MPLRHSTTTQSQASATATDQARRTEQQIGDGEAAREICGNEASHKASGRQYLPQTADILLDGVHRLSKDQRTEG